MASLNLLTLGLRLILLVTSTYGQFTALPSTFGDTPGNTGATGGIISPGTTKLPTPTIRYTFMLPNNLTFPKPNTLPSTPNMTSNCPKDCGKCGFCSDEGPGTCYCFDGCRQLTNSETCIDIYDGCRNLPCQRNGTCVNIPGSYYCLCPHGYAGVNCQNEFDSKERPQITGMSKYRGIIAGGGELRVTGKNFHLFAPIDVTFHSLEGSTVLQGGINRSRSLTSEEFYLITPGTDSSNINKAFTVMVSFTDGFTVNVSGSFVYTDNPGVSNISPERPLVVFNGGARLTLIGTNLDVPSKTFINIVLHVSQNSTKVFSGEGNSICDPHNETASHCQMPDFNIPRNESWVNASNNYDKKFDVRPTYDNHKTNIAIPKNFSFIAPNIIGSQELTYYDPTSKESLKIEAQYVESSTTSLADYKVEIGNMNCTMTYMSSNLLECMPPEDTPLATKLSIIYCNSEGITVTVQAFKSNQFSKCIKYYNSRKPLIIGFSIAAILLITVILIVLFVLRKKINWPKSIPKSLKIPSKAYGSMRDGIINPRATSLYATNLELESNGTSNDADAKIENRSSASPSDEEEPSPGDYIRPSYNEML